MSLKIGALLGLALTTFPVFAREAAPRPDPKATQVDALFADHAHEGGIVKSCGSLF